MGLFTRRRALRKAEGRRVRWRAPAAVAGGAVLLVLCAVLGLLAHGGGDSQAAHYGRRLSGGGCDDGGFAAVPAFALDKAGRVVLYALITAWCFLGLAIVCDDFFQPSLEAISEALHLPPDVAGATFLAAGSSAPELFTSVGDAFGPASSIGVGTIMGSAMFNILIIVAASAMFAGTARLKIDWRPVTRDVSFYTLSVVLFAIVAADGSVDTAEAAVMLIGYAGYIVFMVYNEQLFAKCAPRAKVFNSKLLRKKNSLGSNVDRDPNAVLVDVLGLARAAGAAGPPLTKPRAMSTELAIVTSAKQYVDDVGAAGEQQQQPSPAQSGAADAVGSPNAHLDRRVSTGADYFNYDRQGFREFDTYKKGKKGHAGGFHVPARSRAYTHTVEMTDAEAAAAAAAAATAGGGRSHGRSSKSPGAPQPDASPTNYAARLSSKPPAAFYKKGDSPAASASPTNASASSPASPEDEQPCPTSRLGMLAKNGGGVSAAEGGTTTPEPKKQVSGVTQQATGAAMALDMEGFGRGETFGAGDDDDDDRLAFPSDGSVGEKIYFVLSLPFLLMFTVTVPDCENPRWEKWMWTAFLSSIVWIGAICHMMVQMASHIGCDLGISPLTMGTLVLAVGTSVPDAIGSILAAKSGEADMAIANAIGSNIFDILLGMGLPWLLVNTLKKELVPINIPPAELGLAVGILMFTVFFFVFVLVKNKWCMTPFMGKQLTVLYSVFVIYTIVQAKVTGT